MQRKDFLVLGNGSAERAAKRLYQDRDTESCQTRIGQIAEIVSRIVSIERLCFSELSGSLARGASLGGIENASDAPYYQRLIKIINEF